MSEIKVIAIAAMRCSSTGELKPASTEILLNLWFCEKFYRGNKHSEAVRFVPLSEIPRGMFVIDFFNQEWEDALTIQELREYYED